MRNPVTASRQGTDMMTWDDLPRLPSRFLLPTFFITTHHLMAYSVRCHAAVHGIAKCPGSIRLLSTYLVYFPNFIIISLSFFWVIFLFFVNHLKRIANLLLPLLNWLKQVPMAHIHLESSPLSFPFTAFQISWQI